MKIKNKNLMKNPKIAVVGGFSLARFSLAKFLSAVLTIILVALAKYSISGNLCLEYSDFVGNVSMGLLG